MAKQTGLGDNFYVSGVNVSGDINSLSRIGGGPAAVPVTGIDKSAYERIGGERDGSLEFTSYFNKDLIHPVLKTLPRTDVQACYFRGTTLGNPAAGLVGKQVNYDLTRADDGSLTMDCQLMANGFGLDWGRSLTAGVRSDTAATNGSSIDTTASVSFGAQAFLQVFSFTGTSVSISIEDSADNASFAAVTGLTFATVTSAPAVERLETGRTAAIRRYIRVVTTGTFSQCSFAVVICKNAVATVF